MTFPAWHKFKQTQALPLKEDFRQVPGQVTGQVFQTTWSKECYTSMQILLSKEKQVLNGTKATNVPEVNQIQSVLRQIKTKHKLTGSKTVISNHTLTIDF